VATQRLNSEGALEVDKEVGNLVLVFDDAGYDDGPVESMNDGIEVGRYEGVRMAVIVDGEREETNG